MDTATELQAFQDLDEALQRLNEQLAHIARNCIRQVEQGAEPDPLLDLLQRVASIAIETHKLRDRWHKETVEAWRNITSDTASVEPSSGTVH